LVRRGPRMPTRKGRPPLSEFYRLYIGGQIPGTDGVWWHDRVAAWLVEHRRLHGGWCELGITCAHRRQAGSADHWHYRTLGRERREDVGLACWDCHVRREQLKVQGVDAWAWMADRKA
jgi:hypothetical protein